jgi:hypothetical protein
VRGAALRWLIGGVCVGATLAVAGSALGRSAADDLSVRVHFVGSSLAMSTTSLANDVQFDIFTDGPEQTVTMRYVLPAGLTFGGDVPDPSENCTNGETIVCTIALTPIENLQAAWSWPIVAASPGTYTITASVDGERPDPNPANNSHTFTFEVKPAVVGGGSASVSVSSAKVAPTKPRAGSAVTFSSSVKVSGESAKPSKVTCAATLGGKKATGKPKAATGLASCRYATKKADKGKRLAGSLKVTANGKSFTKRFAATLR